MSRLVPVTSPLERAAMRRAIALSAVGLGTTSPNPPVGCVILDADGHIVGQGYHRRKGEPHAEANALAAAGEMAEDGTAIVTLEPCNHQGRTPPCHQALIDARIRRVLIAVMDPTSRGKGGAARLRQAGIEVDVGVLEAEARLVLDPWLTGLATQLPYLIWPYVLQTDGARTGLATVPDRDQLRRTADVILRPDDSIEEAVPGQHGTGVLNLEELVPVPDPQATLRLLYQAGARLVLLDADPDSDQAAPFLAAGLIREAIVSLLLPEPSSAPILPALTDLLPDGFAVHAVRKVGSYVRIEGRPR